VIVSYTSSTIRSSLKMALCKTKMPQSSPRDTSTVRYTFISCYQPGVNVGGQLTNHYPKVFPRERGGHYLFGGMMDMLASLDSALAVES